MSGNETKLRAKLGASLIEEAILEVLKLSDNSLAPHEIRKKLDFPVPQQKDPRLDKDAIIHGTLINLKEQGKVERDDETPQTKSKWILSK